MAGSLTVRLVLLFVRGKKEGWSDNSPFESWTLDGLMGMFWPA